MGSLCLDEWQGQVAVVTGASSGIGYAIALSLVLQGLKVVGIARRYSLLEDISEKLNGVSQGEFIPAYCDITNETQVVDTFKWIKKNVGPVAILVNNAGIDLRGSVVNGSLADREELLETNTVGQTTCTREALKQMRKTKAPGHIIYINDVLGLLVSDRTPDISVYAATKWATTANAKTIRLELQQEKLNVKVTSIYPGFTDTPLSTRRREETTSETLIEFNDSAPLLDPIDIADACIYTLSTPKGVEARDIVIQVIGENF